MKERSNTTRVQGTIMNRFILMVLLLLFLLPISLQAEARHALVIGNGNYEDLGMLKNPANDATDMAGALSNLGFEVQTLIDADVVSMEEAIVRFGQRLSGSVDSVGFFFYAGHGVQHNGSNYLIPAGAKIASEVFLRTRSISAQAVLDTMQAAGNRLNIVVLDACRDNPFSWARSGQRGLSVVASQPPGSIIAYATSAGSVAGDGDGRNGIFTAELLRILNMPNLDVSELFRLTGQAVQERTAGRQIPAIYSQFFGKKSLLDSNTSLYPNTQQVQKDFVASQTAELLILTKPLGVPITVNGTPKGITPVFISEVPINSILTIEGREGSLLGKIEYPVDTIGLHEVSLDLKMETGHLLVFTNERDAELLLNGISKDIVDIGLLRDLPIGEYHVELYKQGMRIANRVTVQSGRTTNVEMFFKDSDAVIADSRNLSVGYNDVTQNLILQTTGANGTNIQWKSSNPSVVSATGTVFRQKVTQDTSVVLTAEVSKGGISETQQFQIVVKAIDLVIFEDDFSKGLNNWILFGNPSPTIRRNIHTAGFVLDGNGDSNHNSGVYTKERFSPEGPISITARVYMSFTDLRGCWNEIHLGLSTGNPNQSTHNSIANFKFVCVGDACWATDAKYRRKSYLMFGYAGEHTYVSNFAWESSAPWVADKYLDAWQEIKIEIGKDLIPRFYINDTLLYTGPEPIDDAVLKDLVVYVGDRSSGSAGKNYYDWVRLDY